MFTEWASLSPIILCISLIPFISASIVWIIGNKRNDSDITIGALLGGFVAFFLFGAGAMIAVNIAADENKDTLTVLLEDKYGATWVNPTQPKVPDAIDNATVTIDGKKKLCTITLTDVPADTSLFCDSSTTEEPTLTTWGK